MMSNLLTIESAWCDGKFVGYRITCGDESLLVFDDQECLIGFRFGDKFTASYGKQIEYVKIEINGVDGEPKQVTFSGLNDHYAQFNGTYTVNEKR